MGDEFEEGSLKIDRAQDEQGITLEEWDKVHKYCRNKVDTLEWRVRGRLDSLLNTTERHAVLEEALPTLRKDLDHPDLTHEEAYATAHGYKQKDRFAWSLAPFVRKAVDKGARVDVRQIDNMIQAYILKDPKCPEYIKKFREPNRRTFDMMTSATKYDKQIIELARCAVLRREESGETFQRALMRNFVPLMQLGKERSSQSQEAAEWDRRLDEEGKTLL